MVLDFVQHRQFVSQTPTAIFLSIKKDEIVLILSLYGFDQVV